MAALRAILVLALLMHPLLIAGAPAAPLPPCPTVVVPTTSCCTHDCACNNTCPCAVEAPSDTPAPTPEPAPRPTSASDARALPPAPTGLIAILPVIEPPSAAAVAAPHRPFRSCSSVNALLCVWTT